MNKRNIKILVVDDEESIRDILSGVLEAEGFSVITANDGAQALELMSAEINLVILDVTMPGDDGYIICRRIRQTSTVPLLFLTARTQDADMVRAFASGGDDYISKPFSRAELVSRVLALLRRCYEYPAPDKSELLENKLIKRGHLQLDIFKKTASINGTPIILTKTEYELLELMAKYPGKVFSAQNLYEFVWNQKYTYADNNIIIVHISKLRKKLGDNPKQPAIIKNMWGRGYYID